MQDNLYSLGIVIWELLTFCRQPFSSLSDQIVVKLLIGENPKIYKHFLADLEKADIKYKYISLIAALNLNTDPEKR